MEREIMLDAGIIQASLLPREDIECGDKTNLEVYEKVCNILENKNVRKYTEMETLRRACENVKRDIKKLNSKEMGSDEKKYMFSTLSRIASQAFYQGVAKIPTPYCEFEIGIIYPLEKSDGCVNLIKYDFENRKQEFSKKPQNRKFERLLNHTDKDDRWLLTAAYYGNTDFILTTDSRTCKSYKITILYPVLNVNNLSKEEIIQLPYMGRLELRDYVKRYWKMVKCNDRGRKL